MSLQATQATCIKMKMGGKLTKEKVTRMLSEPADIRFDIRN